MYPHAIRSRTAPPIWLAVVLSLLCHVGAAGLWMLWQLEHETTETEDQTLTAATPTDGSDERPEPVASAPAPNDQPLEVAAVREQDLPDDVRRPLEAPVPDPQPEAEPEPQPELARESDESDPEPAIEPEPEPESEPEPEPVVELVPAEPTPPQEMNRIAVDQTEFSDERPLEADFISDRDNVAVEQTLAEEAVLFEQSTEREMASAQDADLVAAATATTEESSLDSLDNSGEESTESPSSLQPPPAAGRPDNAPSADTADAQARQSEQQAQSEAAAQQAQAGAEAAAVANDALAPGPEVSEAGEAAVQDGGDTLQAFRFESVAARAAAAATRASQGEHGSIAQRLQPTLETYEQTFGEGDARLLERARSEVARGSLAGDHEGQWEQTRGTLENFDVHVTTGVETHLTTMADPYARYIHAVHNHIHPRWTAIIARWNITYGIDSSLSDRSLVTVLEYVIDREGRMEDVRIVRSAREPMFMQEAVAMSWSIGPFPPPPPGMLSSDGRTYLHWTFHRDQRQCGTFGASVRFLQDGGTDEGK